MKNVLVYLSKPMDKMFSFLEGRTVAFTLSKNYKLSSTKGLIVYLEFFQVCFPAFY